MSKSATQYRGLVALVMGGLAFTLLALITTLIVGTLDAVRLVPVLVIAGIFAFWLRQGTSSTRVAWGAGCFTNGLLSVGLAIGVHVGDGAGSSGRSLYMDDIDRAIGPLVHLVWAFAARLGLIALLLATILFALSYWFLGPPHRKA